MEQEDLKKSIGRLIWALGLSLPFSIAATNICLGALTAAVLAYARRGGRLPWKEPAQNPIFRALVLYMAAAVICALCGSDPPHSLSILHKDLHKIWVFYVLALALKISPARSAHLGLGASFCALALVGIGQSLASLGGSVWARAHGFVHPVTYGEQMALAVLGGLCLAAEAQSKTSRLWAWIGLALTGLALLCNQSWGALVGVAAGLGALAGARKSLRRYLLPAALAVAGALILFELLPTGRSLAGSLGSLKSKSHSLEGPFQRLRLWEVAWRAFEDHPLTGVGPGNYRGVFTRYFSGSIEGETAFGSAHNLYAHHLAERGLLGLAALLAVLWTLISQAWVLVRGQGGFAACWALAAAAALPAMSLTEEAFQNELLMTLVLLIWSRAKYN